MPPYKIINVGDRFGCYTVLGKSERTGSQEFYNVQCNCGYETTIGKSSLSSNPKKCRMCYGKEYSIMMREKRKELIGKVINGFKIIGLADAESKQAHFLVECVKCGHQSIKPIANMKNKHGEKCGFCPIDFNFEIVEDIAVGHLADGTEFLVDAEDIEIASRNPWYINGNGYLFHRQKPSGNPLLLHREILGLSSDDDRVVDHINHNKLDNRKCNLRAVTQSENCLNNIKRCSNTSGHIGVKIRKKGSKYVSSIEKNGVKYSLLRTDNIIEAAQAYNVAADYLFGVGIGYRNQVMYPSLEFTCSIIEKIKLCEADKCI